MGRQLQFKIKTWGGKRKGAGRPNCSQSANHMERDRVDFRKPLHVTMRLQKNLPSLRSKGLYKDFLKSVRGAKRFGLHVIHFSLLSNHIHMIVEAKDNEALANGMRSLGGRLGKIMRRRARENGGSTAGAVFQGRYHLSVIRSARQMRNALEYVLLNHSKHRKLIEHLDPFSSAFAFREWPHLLGKRLNKILEDQLEIFGPEQIHDLSPPRSWLAKQGWRLATA